MLRQQPQKQLLPHFFARSRCFIYIYIQHYSTEYSYTRKRCLKRAHQSSDAKQKKIAKCFLFKSFFLRFTSARVCMKSAHKRYVVVTEELIRTLNTSSIKSLYVSEYHHHINGCRCSWWNFIISLSA